MHTIVSTIGTSALEKFLKADLQNRAPNPIFLGHGARANNAFNELQTEIRISNKSRLKSQAEEDNYKVEEDLYRHLVERYIEASPDSPPWDSEKSWKDDDWFMMPAEVASILRMKENLQEENYLESPQLLLETDTEESHISAKITETLLKKYGFSNVDRKLVKGFQMEDISLFNSIGIENFMKTVDAIKKESEEMVLNVTGGYKSFIPFASSIASFNKVDMYYVHETAVAHQNSLVKIPYVPIFNTAMAEEKNIVSSTVHKLEKANIQSRSEAKIAVNRKLRADFNSIPNINYQAYTEFVLSFFHFVDGQLRYSPIGRIYYRYLLEGKGR
jgi:putative CRISPR-associated protein (TIGR02619 family)